MIPAQRPVQRPRDAKLLVVDAGGHITHVPRSRFVDFLRPAISSSPTMRQPFPRASTACTCGVDHRSRCGWRTSHTRRPDAAGRPRAAGRRGTATISELAEPFGISLTGMKKHVLVLEDAGLVLTEKVGRARRCTLAPYAFEGITAWLQRLDRFTQVVERTKGER